MPTARSTDAMNASSSATRPGGLAALANPTRFAALARPLGRVLAVAATIAFAIGLALAFAVPDDYQQGRTVRIMFVHVPAVWMAMGAYVVMVSGALGVLVWRHPLADVAARAAAPLGAAFTFLGLVTGSVWGRPMWGAWWVWDARLTSFLVLLLIYGGLIALWRAIEEPATGARVGAVVVLLGAVNLPIIKFSVDWWNTLHQPASVLRAGGPAMPAVYLQPLLVMALAFLLLFAALHLKNMRNILLERRIRRLEQRRAHLPRTVVATLSDEVRP